MSWEIRNLMCDIEIVKEKLEDVATTHTWFVDERFTKRSLKTKEEVVISYLKELEGLMNKYKEIEKASSDVSLATESDNA
ncbi:MAG: DUF1474 family protein [Staphylococcus epidermidis]|nr:DUF1474 family protein [Staphylococcus epidermidis]